MGLGELRPLSSSERDFETRLIESFMQIGAQRSICVRTPSWKGQLENGLAVVIVVGDDIVLGGVVKGETSNLETVDKGRLSLAPSQGGIIRVECKWCVS
jgi:hypothetical protein